MKKLGTIVTILTITLIFVAGAICFNVKESRDAELQQKIAHENKVDYELLDLKGNYNKEVFQGVEGIDEDSLKIALFVYKDVLSKNDANVSNILTYEDVVEYLSSAIDENGKNKVLNRPENLEAYYDWKVSPDVRNGEILIDEYCSECMDAQLEYIEENEGKTNLTYSDVGKFDYNQFIELRRMIEENDYSYSAILEEK